MSQVEAIGWTVGALATIGGLIILISTPFAKLTEAINRLVLSVELLKQTVEVFKDLFEKQEDINDEFETQINQIQDDLRDFKHHCEKVHYYKDREP